MDTENPVRIENAGSRAVREIIMVSTMTPFFIALLGLVTSTLRNRAAQQAEIVALRHQIAVLQQSAPRRLRVWQSDRLLWIWLSRWWPTWRHWLRILKPDTVVRWHRTAFVRYWTRKSRRRPGRPSLAAAIRDLIQQMSQANFLWGAPRIHGELLKLGIEVAPSTVGKYLRRRRSPPSTDLAQTRREATTASVPFIWCKLRSDFDMDCRPQRACSPVPVPQLAKRQCACLYRADRCWSGNPNDH